MPSPAAEPIDLAAKYPRRGLILFASVAAMFMSAVEQTIVATAMPSIVADLQGFHLFSWVFAGYILAQAVAVLIYGRLADIYGRKRVFFVGIAIFLFGSLMCGFMRSMPLLVVFRIVQGIGGGSIQTLATTIVGDIYTPVERGRVQAYISAAYGTASLMGPVLGGFIVEHLHWSFIFWINIPIGILVILLLAVLLDEKIERRPHQIDYVGSLLLTVGIGALMFPLVQASDLSASWIALLLTVSLTFLAVFYFYQQRIAEPVVPLKLLNHRVILLGTFISFTIGAVIMSVIAFTPTYVQGAMARSPAIAGIVVAVAQVTWWVGSLIGGRLIVRTSYRFMILAGGACLTLGTGLLVAVQAGQTLFLICAALAFIGIGMGFTNVSVTVSIQSSGNWRERGVLTSAMYFMRMLGMSIGTSLYGGLFNFGLSGNTDAVNELIHGSIAPGAGTQLLADTIASSLHNVYVLATVFAVITIVLGYFIPKSLSPSRPADH